MNILFTVLLVLAIIVIWYITIRIGDYFIDKDLKMFLKKSKNYKHLKPLFTILPFIIILLAIFLSILCIGTIILIFS